jgi:hypothetical protein
MNDFRLSRKLCAVVGESVSGSHATLEALFTSSGAPGEPPDLAHHSKWKEWLFRAGQDQDVDSLKVLGNILEEFMDVEPVDPEVADEWRQRRDRVQEALETEGLNYYQGGRVIPNGGELAQQVPKTPENPTHQVGPSSLEALLTVIVRGLPRAAYPLSHRRKGATNLSFRSEYDVQDLLHAMLRPWVADVRAEEFTPSYAGSSTRMDFLLPAHETVIETKIVRDRRHAGKIGDELVIDIAHYAAHPKCKHLWCVIYDPARLIKNEGGMTADLDGTHSSGERSVDVCVIVV